MSNTVLEYQYRGQALPQSCWSHYGCSKPNITSPLPTCDSHRAHSIFSTHATPALAGSHLLPRDPPEQTAGPRWLLLPSETQGRAFITVDAAIPEMSHHLAAAGRRRLNKPTVPCLRKRPRRSRESPSRGARSSGTHLRSLRAGWLNQVATRRCQSLWKWGFRIIPLRLGAMAAACGHGHG